MRLVNGNELSARARAEVLRAFVYRLATENGYPTRNPCAARVPAVTDAEWLASHAFYVRKDGGLAVNRRYCEPAYMAEREA